MKRSFSKITLHDNDPTVTNTKDSMCSNKKTYENKGIAEMVMNKQNQRYDSKLNVYKCTFCHNWHIGAVSYQTDQMLTKQKEKEYKRVKSQKIRTTIHTFFEDYDEIEEY